MADTKRITPARRAALEVMYRAPRCRARQSNQTTTADSRGRPSIYWQTRAWLTREGLAQSTRDSTMLDGWYELTIPGIELAERVLYRTPTERAR